MKRVYRSEIALLALASLPLVAQSAPRARHASTAPEVAEVESSPGHSYLGVGVVDLNSDRVQALKLKDDRGVEVSQVDQDAPAGKAGLKEHDVIVGFNGTPVESQEQFKRLMRETPPGRTVSLDIMREGQQQSVKVQLADRKKLESTVWPHEPRGDFAFAMPVMPAMPPMPPMPDYPRAFTERTITRMNSVSGATLESLTPQLGDFFGVKNGEGMLVRSVQKGSPAESAGLRAGDVVVRVGEQRVTDRSDWTEALRNNKNGKVPVVIVRDKKEQTLSLSVPPRKGPDSSALYGDDSPEVEEALEAAAGAVEGMEPFVEEQIEDGASATMDWFNGNRSEVDHALKKSMEQLHREMIDNRGEIDRNLSQSLKIACAKLKEQAPAIENAMREAQHALENIRIRFGSDVQ
jgi:serine protease Do